MYHVLRTWGCQTSSQCGATKCCLTVTITNTTTCPPFANGGSSACSTSGQCASGDLALCTSNADCPTGYPTCTVIFLSGMSTPIGVCM